MQFLCNKLDMIVIYAPVWGSVLSISSIGLYSTQFNFESIWVVIKPLGFISFGLFSWFKFRFSLFEPTLGFIYLENLFLDGDVNKTYCIIHKWT